MLSQFRPCDNPNPSRREPGAPAVFQVAIYLSERKNVTYRFTVDGFTGLTTSTHANEGKKR